MNYFVYINKILGVCTDLDRFNWVYGSVAPKSNKNEFNNCKIKVYLKIKNTKDAFDVNDNVRSFDRYNYFYAQKNNNKVYYERSFLFHSKLRFVIEIIDNNTVNVVVNKNYYRFIKYKFMNLHSLGYILTDIVSGLLLLNGYATLYCSAVKTKDKAIAIFAPPSAGKTITAIKLCENKDVKFIAEDIALTDGTNIYSVPWTSTFRFYNLDKENTIDRFLNTLREKVPIFQLIPMKSKRPMAFYLEEDRFVDTTKITDIIVLGKGERSVARINEGMKDRIINLNKYALNYHKSPTMLVLNYFNANFSLDDMYAREKSIIETITRKSNTYCIKSDNVLDYHTLIEELQ